MLQLWTLADGRTRNVLGNFSLSVVVVVIGIAQHSSGWGSHGSHVIRLHADQGDSPCGNTEWVVPFLIWEAERGAFGGSDVNQKAGGK